MFQLASGSKLPRSTYVPLWLFLCTSACTTGSSPNSADLSSPPGSDLGLSALLAIAGSDFTSGMLSTLEPATRTVRKSLDVIDAQPVARGFGSQLYILDQTHGAVRAYDARLDFKNPTDFPVSKTGVVDGAQANPHDIYLDTERKLAYVSLYGSAGSTQVGASRALGVIDLTAAGAGLSRFIPLAVAGGDTDGNPEADRLVGCGNTLYVLLQDLDRQRGYVPAGPGRLAVIDLTGGAAPRYIQLAGENPTAVTLLPGCTEAIVGSAGDQYGGVLSGRSGIERVNLGRLQTLGLALKDTDLGGNVSTLDALDATQVFADIQVKSGMSYSNTVYAVDTLTKKKGAALLGRLAFVPAVRVMDGNLVVLSSGAAGIDQLPTGLYLGAASGAPLATTPLDVGLPPQSVALVYR